MVLQAGELVQWVEGEAWRASSGPELPPWTPHKGTTSRLIPCLHPSAAHATHTHIHDKKKKKLRKEGRKEGGREGRIKEGNVGAYTLTATQSLAYSSH